MTDATASDTPTPRRRRGFRFLRFLLYAFVSLGLAAAMAGAAAYLVYDHVTRPGMAGDPVDIDIPEGATGRRVAQILEERGLVEHEAFLRLAMRLEPGPAVKHGPYRLEQGLSPLQLLERLRRGPNRSLAPSEIDRDRVVTVPEGLSIAQAAQLFENPEAFIEAASDPVLVARLGVEVDTLEGFLMPNTYYFDKKPTEAEVVERMLNQFLVEYEKLMEEFPEARERDLLEVVTVASLVEEEGKVDEERPLIAAVIYNRVDKRMALGIDATLQYALNKYGQRMLDKDKEVDSPYNTYARVGLPPGPISSPGLAALRAALDPADEEYLYFVSNADGRTHTFSKTLAEHNRAVAEYRRKIAAQRRALREAGSAEDSEG